MRTSILALLFIGAAAAQQTVAPTPEPVGPVRGDNVSDYNILAAQPGQRKQRLAIKVNQSQYCTCQFCSCFQGYCEWR